MDTISWLKKLIAFDTTSRLSNLQIITEIQNWLEQHHIQSRITHDPVEPKANLFATLKSCNGSSEGGLILSGHTDVVPVDGQQWDTDLFSAVQIGDKIYGRGACDMKGFIAVVLALIPEFQRMSLPYPIHFAFSYDEEIGCRGASLMIADLQQAGLTPKACEAGIFEKAHIPTILCGPGNIEQAHRANEFVTIQQLNQCTGFLREIVLRFVDA